MKRAAIYARVSTEHQTSSSLETQIKTCKEFCNKQGWIVSDIFQEKDSGGKVAREEFQVMISRALNGVYDVIVVEKFDRFFRNDIEDRRYTRMLEKKGILVISALEGIDPTSASGKLLRWILSDINWFQREYMKEEQMRKSKQAASQGYWMGGIPPFGYKTIEVKDGERKRKKLVIDEPKAHIVRQIFQWYADGYSIPRIIQMLSDRNMLHNGKPWSKTTLYDIIHNPKYLGVYTWNVPRRSMVSTPEGIVVEGAVPAIVDPKTAEKVKQRFKVKKAPISIQRHFWLLSGKLQCGICGKNMHGNPHPRRPVYRCDEKDHEYLGISKQYVENYVINYLKHVFKKIDTDKLVQEYISTFRTQAEILKMQKKEVFARLQELKEEEKKIVDAIMKGINLDLLQEKAKEIKREQEKLQKELQGNISVPSDKEIKAQFEKLRKLLESPSSPEKQRQVVEGIVEKVVVYPKRVVVVELK